MEITYKSRRIEKVCTLASEAEKKYGLEMAEKNPSAYERNSCILILMRKWLNSISEDASLKRQSKRPIRNGFSSSLQTCF